MYNSSKGGKVGRKRKADCNQGEPKSKEEIRRLKGCEAARKHRQKKLDELNGLQERNDQLKKEIADFTEKCKNLKKLTLYAETLMQQHRDAGCSLPNPHQECELFAGNTLCDEVILMEQTVNDNSQPAANSSTDEDSSSQPQLSPLVTSNPKALFSGETLPLTESLSPSPQQMTRLQVSSPVRQTVVFRESHLTQNSSSSPVIPSGQDSLPVPIASSHSGGIAASYQTSYQTSQQISPAFHTIQHSKPFNVFPNSNQQSGNIPVPLSTNQYNQHVSASFQTTLQSQQKCKSFPTAQQSKLLSTPFHSSRLSQQQTGHLNASQHGQLFTSTFPTEVGDHLFTKPLPPSQQNQLVGAFSIPNPANKIGIASNQENQHNAAPSQTSNQNHEVNAVFQNSQQVIAPVSGNQEKKELTAPVTTINQDEQQTAPSQTSYHCQQVSTLFNTTQQGKQHFAPSQNYTQGQQVNTTSQTSQQTSIGHRQLKVPFETSAQSQQIIVHHQTTTAGKHISGPPQTRSQGQQIIAPSQTSHRGKQFAMPIHNSFAVTQTVTTIQQSQASFQAAQQGKLVSTLVQAKPQSQQLNAPFQTTQQYHQVNAPLHSALETATCIAQPLQSTNMSTCDSWKVGTLQMDGKSCKVLYNDEGQYIVLTPALEKEINLNNGTLLIKDSSFSLAQEFPGQDIATDTNNFELAGNIPNAEVLGCFNQQDLSSNPMNEHSLNNTENLNVLKLSENTEEIVSYGQQEPEFPVKGPFVQNFVMSGVQESVQFQPQRHTFHQEIDENNIKSHGDFSPSSNNMLRAEGQQVFSKGTALAITTPYTTRNASVLQQHMNSSVTSISPCMATTSQQGSSSYQQNITMSSYKTPKTVSTMSNKLNMHLQQMTDQSTQEFPGSTLSSVSGEDYQIVNYYRSEMGPGLRFQNQGKF